MVHCVAKWAGWLAMHWGGCVVDGCFLVRVEWLSEVNS